MFSTGCRVPIDRRYTSLVRAAWAVFIIAALVLIVLLAAPVAGAELAWNGESVVGYARLAPLDRLQRDLEFLAEGVGERAATSGLHGMLAELARGIDPSRPAGAVVYVDVGLIPILFFPVKDEDQLFAALRARFGWEFYRGDDGLYRGGNVNVVARVAGAWIYVTGSKHRESLAQTPDDPTALFVGLDSTVTAQAILLLDQVPAELRTVIGSTMAGVFGESEESGSADRPGVALLRRLTDQLFTDSRKLEVELQCFRPLEQFHLTARLAPMEGSPFARWLAVASERTATFEHLASDDATAALISSLTLPPKTVEPLLEAWHAQAAKAQAAAPSPRASDPMMRRLGKLVEQSLGAVTTTLRKGEFDGGVVLERHGKDRFTLLAGGMLYGSRELEQTATDVAQMLLETPEFKALNWAATGNGDVSIHQFQFPLSHEGARRMFGDELFTALGFGPDHFYAAFGDEEALARLSFALDRSRDDAPARGEPLRVTLRMAPVMALLDTAPGADADAGQQLHIMAERIASYRRNDTLELSIKAREPALESRLRVDMGVVRMFVPEIPAVRRNPPSDAEVPKSITPSVSPGSGRIALRLARGEKFQLEYYTDSKMTTTIAGHDRIDQSRHSLLYEFHVLDVAPDGVMQIAASLNRVTIDKTTPEGKTVFDSAHPPEAEQMNAEMLLHALLVNRKLMLTIRPDGSIEKVTGLDEAIESVLDHDLKPPANEREQARSFVQQVFNDPGIRDGLTRGFEFYPDAKVAVGDRWSRTSENYSGINFLLDDRYALQTIMPGDATISVKSQVREKEQANQPEQPIRWDIVGAQSGSIHVNPESGRLRLAEYALRLQGEATVKVDGKDDVRPIIADFTMIVGKPERVAAKKAQK